MHARTQAKLDRAIRAAERAIVRTEAPRLGLRERVRRWRAARRQRARVRRLDRALRDGRARVEEQTSAALLAVLTERIANLGANVSATAVAEAIAIASRVRGDYEAQMTRVIELHDSARAKLSFWQERLVVAEQLRATELVDPVRARIADCERAEQAARDAVSQCEAAHRRIEDAFEQLMELAERLDNSSESK